MYGALATLLLLYPGEYDSAKKSRFGRALLVGNASAALAGGASISILTWLTAASFALADDPIPYLWCGVVIFARLLAFVHVPIAFSFRRADSEELALLNEVVKIAGDILYDENLESAVDALSRQLESHESIMAERGLYDLSASIVARGRSSSVRPADMTRLLMERASSIAVTTGSRPATPFKGLNEMMTAASAGVIVALSVQLALQGGN